MGWWYVSDYFDCIWLMGMMLILVMMDNCSMLRLECRLFVFFFIPRISNVLSVWVSIGKSSTYGQFWIGTNPLFYSSDKQEYSMEYLFVQFVVPTKFSFRSVVQMQCSHFHVCRLTPINIQTHNRPYEHLWEAGLECLRLMKLPLA